MVKVMFGVVAATLLGFSCRADAWGGKKDEVRDCCLCARLAGGCLPSVLQLPLRV